MYITHREERILQVEKAADWVGRFCCQELQRETSGLDLIELVKRVYKVGR